MRPIGTGLFVPYERDGTAIHNRCKTFLATVRILRGNRHRYNTQGISSTLPII